VCLIEKCKVRAQVATQVLGNLLGQLAMVSLFTAEQMGFDLQERCVQNLVENGFG
jgi:hypothetical protein